MAGDALIAGLVAGIIMKEDEQQDKLDDQDDHPAAGAKEVPEFTDCHSGYSEVGGSDINEHGSQNNRLLKTFEMRIARDDRALHLHGCGIDDRVRHGKRMFEAEISGKQ
jgi:hypothetical protein